MAARKKAVAEIISKLTKVKTRKQLDALKRSAGKKHGLAQMISNSELLEAVKGDAVKRRILRMNPGRSLSGVSVVAVMTKPLPCPGTCIYCPGGKTSPKSYTGHEPAALRASQNKFDAFKQVRSRLEQLEASGHDPEKCELIVMGGTFNSTPLRYQNDFVRRTYDAFNGKKSKTLEQAIKLNETAKHRVVGFTFETRPDWASRKQLKHLLGYGATRIELGVQSLDEAVLRKVKRGHGIAAVEESTRDCKDAFLKVCYHVMPGLFSNARKDEAMFKQLFEDDQFKPDMLKVYPCLVMPGTKLYEMWARGEYEPYSSKQAASVLAKCKKHVPEYCRIMRVERDIPTHQIGAGIPNTNLREMVVAEMKKRGETCKCIRCREPRAKKIDWRAVKLVRRDYEASGGQEVFLSFEDSKNDLLLGFLRLRKTKRFWVEGGEQEAAGVRELHVYGEAVPIGAASKAVQHKQFGKKLLHEAEQIAKQEWGFKELRVLSGVGVRAYYRKLGYDLKSGYMLKTL
ncbi:MAG: tRNA uridine(34) 5-carboxymethylaminomethyl modification radical SAM/GNAT enzyme Elp3 [Candidatus Micrarchaeota archaeon]